MQRSFIYRILLIALTVTSCLMLSGCYDARETDDLAYVIAIGLDKGKTNALRLTLQYAVPKNIGSGGGGGQGGGGGENPSSITTVETPTLWSGLNMVNNYTSRQVNMAHIKALVISEELAREGIEQYLHAIIRSREFRPSTHVVVSTRPAHEYIEAAQPILELNPAKYYELAFRSSDYTGFIPRINLHDFYFNTESLHQQGYAIISCVNQYEDVNEFNLSESTFREKGHKGPFEGDFYAGDVTRVGDVKAEVIGTAVFDGAKMVGKLDGEETSYFLMSAGQFIHAYWSFPDPRVPDRFVILDVRQNRKPKINVTLANNRPFITLRLNLEADILSIQSGENYEAPEQLDILEAHAEEILKKGTLRTVNKTAHQYRSDIFGFGRHARNMFLTWKQWEELNWKEIFQNSEFSVNVDLNIRRPGLIIRSSPAVSSQGKTQ